MDESEAKEQELHDRRMERARATQQAIREAHSLLVWTYQHAIDTDEMPARGWWHVKDLHPGVYNTMNAAEQSLYTALMKLPE